MITRLLAPALLAGAAVAVAFAPAAGADTADCENGGAASICQRDGHTSIYAEPAYTGQRNGINWPLGTGPIPPVFALD